MTSISELRNVFTHCQTNLVNWYVNRFTDYRDSRAIILVDAGVSNRALPSLRGGSVGIDSKTSLNLSPLKCLKIQLNIPDALLLIIFSNTRNYKNLAYEQAPGRG